MDAFLKGVAPSRILEQVKNTAPFLGDLDPKLPFIQTLNQGDWSNHYAYFTLCLSAHYTTVATFVPTDLDVFIRRKLWDSAPSDEIRLQMTAIALQSRHWDFRSVSARWLTTPSGRLITGHMGEWFSVIAAALGSTKNADAKAEIRKVIQEEIDHHAIAFGELVEHDTGSSVLFAAPLLAHNLGDLERVLKDWRMQPMQASTPALQRWLDDAGEINRRYTAIENHRHYPLRPVRGLRRSADLLLPIGPFFEAWGRKVAMHPLLSEKDVGETVQALIEGWEKLVEPVGYARALHGIESKFRGGREALCRLIPSASAKKLKSGPLRTLVDVSEERFRQAWEARVTIKKIESHRIASVSDPKHI